MAGNIFGKHLTLTTFGESHGLALGFILDGIPAGLPIDVEQIQLQLDRRRPGQSVYTTARNESDHLSIVSGIFEGTTLGTPIAGHFKNTDQRASDYDTLKNIYRPSHADYTWQAKYGIRDYRGGGRSSARETIARVAAGNIAEQLLRHTCGIEITAFVKRIGSIESMGLDKTISRADVDKSLVRCPDLKCSELMEQEILLAKESGETLGGIVSCVIKNCPVGLGEPVFDKLQADLAKAMLSINAVKGFEYGSGFDAASSKGSEHNDTFTLDSGEVKTKTNYSGGIQGGISNGMDITFNVAFKPVSTIQKQQNTIDIYGNTLDYLAGGRHDPCVVPRAIPIVEGMAALVIAEHWLRKQTNKI